MISLIACILNIGEYLQYNVFAFQEEHFASVCILWWTGLHKDHSNSFLHGRNIIWWVILIQYGRVQCDVIIGATEQQICNYCVKNHSTVSIVLLEHLP